MLKSVSEMLYRAPGAEASPWLVADLREPRIFLKDCSMTLEIFYLTAQIHNWLNVRVARHLAAQAAKFTH
jgi:hypothetical protein